MIILKWLKKSQNKKLAKLSQNVQYDQKLNLTNWLGQLCSDEKLRIRLGVHKGMEWNDHKGMEMKGMEWNVFK